MAKRAYYLLIVLIGYSIPLKAQVVYQSTDSTDISFTVNLIEKDSQYFLIPTLIVKKKGIKIRIPEKRFYVDGVPTSQHPDAIIFLAKKISFTYTYITLADLSYLTLAQLNNTKFINYEYGDVLNDTINLQDRYPLEPGEYRVLLEMSYWNGKKKISIQ